VPIIQQVVLAVVALAVVVLGCLPEWLMAQVNVAMK
jgi:hypothetical protein